MTPCKKVGQNTYYYTEYMSKNVRTITNSLALAHGIGRRHGYNVVKLGPDTVSFLRYQRLIKDPFPALQESWTVRITGRTVRHATYNQDDPPILHRKELLFPTTSKIHARALALTRQCEEAGLFKDTKRIGRKSVWDKMLREAGINGQ
jgi:hypothetical protein